MGSTSVSLETIRYNVSGVPAEKMKSSGYFVYDYQYVHIDSIARHGALMNDTNTSNF